MSLDKFLRVKAKTCKQRKLANIRARNAINKIYTNDKLKGRILDYKIVGVVIRNGVQSVGVKLIPRTPAKDINVTVCS